MSAPDHQALADARAVWTVGSPQGAREVVVVTPTAGAKTSQALQDARAVYEASVAERPLARKVYQVTGTAAQGQIRVYYVDSTTGLPV